MGITQNTGASSQLKPGVIDNTAARPASPFEGQVVFQKDTDQLLVWNGTAWVVPNSPAQNPTGLELITAQSIPGASTSFSFTNFTSTYTNYQVKVRIDYVSNDCDLHLRYSTGGVPDAGNSYFSATLGLNDGGGGANSNQGPATFQTVGPLDSAQANGHRSVTMEIFSPLETARTEMTYSSWGYSQAGTGTYLSGGGCYNTGQVHTGFTMFPSNGTSIIGGTYQVYGYRK